ncbi:tandem-95 repeat protein, partial [bacterium]|nr:tandem-95 repeat protein [bacterium]
MRSAVIFCTAVLLLLTIGGNSVQARIRHVPNNFETIQDAINAAQEGDTVLVQPGRYVENIFIIAKNITVASLYLTTGDDTFIERTIIDGDEIGSVVNIRNDVTPEGILCGFTITNGRSNYGGGLYINASEPTLDHLLIVDNVAVRHGGGIYSTQVSDPVLVNLTVANNTAQLGNGGISTFNNSDASIINSIFWGNDRVGMPDNMPITYSDIQGGYGGTGNINQDPGWVDEGRGDFHLTEDSPCIDTGDPDSRNDRDGSRADIGAFFFNQGNVRVFNVPDEYGTIQEAIDATEDGDTVMVQPGEYTENIDFTGKEITVSSLYIITNDEDYIHNTIINGGGNGSVVTFNTSETENSNLIGFTIRNGQADQGGGILISRAHPTLRRLEVEANQAASGGGIYMNESDCVIEFVSIIGNTANRDGGGISCYNSMPIIYNCTICANTTNREGGGFYTDENCQIRPMSCIFWGNEPAQIAGDGELRVTYSDIQDGYEGEGNIETDPLFADPDRGDFHLTWENWRDEDETKSPCIDTGDPDRIPDPEGTRADMGAYYWHQEPYRAIIVVNPQALNAQINTGNRDTLNYNVANEGDTTLVYNTEVDITLEPEGAPRRDRRGGPDEIEYKWRDNDEEDGPTYSWIDVSHHEDVTEVPMGNDVSRGPYDLGFEFEYYGNTYTSVRMCSNGWASFTNNRAFYSYANWEELPTNRAPDNFLGVAMSDWNPSDGGEYYFWTDDEMAVLSWENCPHWSGLGNWTFQIILYATGMIKYQYAETGSPDGRQLVGLQDLDKEHGFEILRDEEDYLVAERAIAISRVWEQWIRIEPVSGQIAVEGNRDFDVIINAEELIEGDYAADIHILTNDPENLDVIVTVSLEVIGIPLINVVWDNEFGYPDNVNWNAAYDNVLVGYDYDIGLDVYNEGTAALSIDSVRVDNAAFFVEDDQLTVPASDVGELIVTFSTNREGEHQGTMTIYSSDAENSEYEIALIATAEILRPDIEIIWTEEAGFPDRIDWNSVYEEVFTGIRYEVPVTIRNTGRRDLEIIEITPGNRYFSADADNFVIEPDDAREVNFNFNADEAGEVNTVITIRNNTETNPQYTIAVHAAALRPPVIALEPDEINDSLYVGWVSEIPIEVSNNGEANLRFTVEHEIINEPERDQNNRSLRGVNRAHAPRRDDAGDLLGSFNGINAANNYCSIVGWDRENEVMWVSNYNDGVAAAYTHDDNYENFEEVASVNPGSSMDGGVYHGLAWMGQWAPSVMGRYDVEGNNVGNIQMPTTCYGLAFDNENDLMFIMTSEANQPIRVYQMDDDDHIGQQIGNINNHYAYHNNIYNYGLEWVPEHRDAPLWMMAYNNGTLYQIGVDQEEWQCFDYEDAVSFNAYNGNAGTGYGGAGHDGQNMWCAGYTPSNIRVYDDGVTERGWISYEPTEGVVNGGENTEINLILDAIHRSVGFYEADVIFRSNDPNNHAATLNVRLYISEPPNLVVEWDDDYGFPQEVNWNMAFDDLYNNVAYDLELNLYNYDDEDIDVASIDFHGEGAEFFSVDNDEFTIEPDEQVVVTVTLEADQSGEHEVTMIINSNAAEREEYPVPLIGETFGPPAITMESESLQDDLITGEVAEHNLTISNDGESRLVVALKTESYSEPNRDVNARSLRSAHSGNAPRRDDAGELLGSFNGINAANNYCSILGWDSDAEVMWVSNYNNGVVAAYTHDNNYENFEEVVRINPGNCMDGGVYGGLCWIGAWAPTTLGRYDIEGNNVGNIQFPTTVYGLAFDSENELCFHQTSEANQSIRVYEMDDLNLGEQIGNINNHMAYHGNQSEYGIEWVSAHGDAPLWMFNYSNSMLYQIGVDKEEWQCYDYEDAVSFTIFNNGSLGAQYGAVGHDGENMWAAGYSPSNIRIYDDGVVESNWLQIDPTDAEIAADGSRNFTVTLDATGLIGGEYRGAVWIETNDPDNVTIEFPVTMNVDDAPDIEVVWSDDYGYPDSIDWNKAFEGIYKDLQYEIVFTVISSGVTQLEVNSIQIDDGAFSPNINRLDLEPNERRNVELLFEPTDAGEYNATLEISSNSEAHPQVRIPMTAVVENAPEIVIDPDEIEDFIMLGNIIERTVTVENQGDALLRFEVDVDLTGEPERDENKRSLRNAKNNGVPRRDNAGDLLGAFNGINAANNYCSIVGWDRENEVMWVSCYNNGTAAAYTHDSNYENFEEVARVNPGNSMDGGVYHGLAWMGAWAPSSMGRYDFEGNNVGNIQMPTTCYGLAFDNENDLMFMMTSEANQPIRVYEMDDDDHIGQQVGNINNHYAYHNNIYNYGLEWVPEHGDAPLWMMAYNNGMLYQIGVDQEEWQCFDYEDAVSFNAYNGNAGTGYGGVGHDGQNMWAAGYSPSNIRIYDDGVSELRWITLDPIEGEVASGDNNSMELALTLNTTDLVLGDYTADIYFLSNDPATPETIVQVIMHVLEAPDIEVTWEHFDEGNPDLVDWSDYYQEVFAGYQYDVPITIRNIGDETLNVEDISTQSNDFTANPVQLNLAPNNQQQITITFGAMEQGDFEDVLTISSNDPDEEVLTLHLQASVLAIPRITVSLNEIIDELEAGSSADYELNIGNVGEENLRWWSEVEIQNEPGRDLTDARSLRRISRGIPERDDLGEIVNSFSWEHSGDNRHKAGIAWDRENEWMWLTCYNTDYLGAVDPADDYAEVISWNIAPQHPMGAAWLNSVVYVLNWGRNWLGRWDADGNNLGNLDTPVRATGLTSSDEYLMIITDDENRNILVLNEDGNRVGIIDNYRQYIEGSTRSIQWINLHSGGELWLNTPGHIYQIDINSDWDATNLANDFEWEGSQEWDGVGHDGENLWLGPWNQPVYYIVDDEIEESRWLTVIPARGIITPDEDQDLIVYLDARVDYAGDYAANIHFTSNDPVDPDVVVTVQLAITGEADIVVEPELLDFEEVEHGTSTELEFTILNDGYIDLTVSDITIEGEFFSIGDLPDEDIVIRPHNDYTLSVEFAPDELELGYFEGTVTVTSDDPDEETVEIALQGTSIYIEYPPQVINPIDDIELDEDFEPYIAADLDTVFSDANHDELSFRASSADENLVVEIINGTQLRLDSEDNWYGEAVVTVIADDGNEARDEAFGRILRSAGGGADSPRRDPATPTEFTVTVNSINDAPEIVSAIPDQEFAEDSGDWIIADLDTVFTDVDGDDLEFTVDGDEDLILYLDDENILTIGAGNDFYGADLSVTVTADDGQERTNDEFIVAIFNVNDPPEVVEYIDDVEFEEDSGPWEIVDIDDVFFDVDGDELIYNVDAEEPLEATFDDDNILTLEAPDDFNGENLEVIVTADDQQDERAVLRFSINQIGRDDILVGGASRDNGPIRNLRGTTDNQSDGVTNLASPQLLTSKLERSGFNNNPSRDYAIEEGFNVTIIPVNDPPVWNDLSHFIRVDENELIEFEVSGYDVDGDDLDISFTSDNLPEAAHFTDIGSGSGEFSWQTNYDDSGEYQCTLTLSDGEYNVDTEVRFRIDHVNRRPEYSEETPREVEVNENELLEIILSGTDPDGDEIDITYTRINIPNDADVAFEFDGENTGTFQWQTTFEDEGEYTARFTMSDGNIEVIRNVTITVIGINRRPEWEREPIDQAVHEEETIEFTIVAGDPDGDEIDITMASDDLPEEVDFRFDGDSTATFSWETDFNSEGNYSATFTASDGSLSLVTEIDIAVGNVNRRPRWDELPDPITVSEGELIEFHVAGSDPDEEELSIDSDIPEGAEFVDYGDGAGDFTWQTYHDDSGDYVVTLTLSDGDLTRIAEISITVEQDNILNVPAEYETIQAAIEKSADGDTVLVEPGEYRESINFIGKNIVLMGNSDDPSEVVIDARSRGACVTFMDSETDEAILKGFTLIDGSGYEINDFEQYGGAVYCLNASPTLEHLVITENSAVSGGGIYIDCDEAAPTIRDIEIFSNGATGGSGIYSKSSSGEAIHLIRVMMYNNHANFQGAISTHPNYAHNFIIENSTLAYNEANENASGIYLRGECNAEIINSIVWGNTNGSILVEENATVVISYSDVEGGADAISGDGGVEWQDGSIDADPLFVNPEMEDGDFHLTWENYPEYNETRSPCLNSGDPESDDDPDGTRADMGAYYYDHTPTKDISTEPSEAIDFGEVSVADANDENLMISNVGEITLTTSNIRINGEGFTVDFGDEFDLTSGEEQAFTVTFAPEHVGEFEATMTITSNDPNEGSVVITLTGIGVNDAPEITSPIDDVELDEDFEPFVIANLNEVFSDPNGDELSFDVSCNVEQFNVELINGSQLQISSVEHWFGDAVVTIIADDGIGAERDRGPVRSLRNVSGSADILAGGNNPSRDDETEEQFNVHVNAVNDPPVWISIPEDTTIEESDLIEFDIIGEDVDDEELTITEDIPEGAEFTDNGHGTGHFSWQTNYDDAGEHTLTFILSDEEYDVETVVTISVTNVNRAPEWTQAPVDCEIDENQLLEFDIIAEDPDGDDINITHRFADLPDEAEFSFDGENTGSFSWQPTFDDAGEYTAEFTVTDGELETVSEITITVIHVNRTPAWVNRPADQEVREGQTLRFEISGSDPDRDQLNITYSSDDLPGGIAFNFNNATNVGTFAWNTTYDDAGEYSATFTLTDGDFRVEETITITVIDVNRTPAWTNFQENVEIAENEQLELTVNGEDPDGDEVSIDFSSDELPEGWEFTDSGNGSGTLIWQTSFDDEGEYLGTFTLADAEFTVESDVTITVTNVNRAPVFTDIPETAETNEDQQLQFRVTGSDPDGNDLTITLINLEDLPEGITLTDNHNGTADFNWQPGYDDSGVYEAVFAVSDGDLTAESVVEITVYHVNRTPAWIDAPENQAVNENEEVRFTISAEDPDGDEIEITWASDELPDEAEFTFDGENSGTFVWQTDYEDEGNFSASFTVSDAEFDVTTEITISVGDVNRPPQWINPPELVELDETDILDIRLEGNDPDGDEMTIEYVSDDLPEGFEFADIGEGVATLYWETGYEDAGEYTAEFTLSDGEFDTELEITIIVTDVNRTPEVIQNINDVTIDEDPDPRRIDIADLDDVFSDPDGDELYFTFDGNTEEMQMNIDDDNVLYFVPDQNYNLSDGVRIVITADDSREDLAALADWGEPVGPIRQLKSRDVIASTSSINHLMMNPLLSPRRDDAIEEDFMLTINPVNDSPVWDEYPQSVEASETDVIEYYITGSDVDGDDLEISMTSDNLPEGATLTDNGGGSGRFYWETGYEDFGDYTAVFTLSDGDLTSEIEVSFRINNLNRAPYWTNIPESVEEDETEELRFEITGEDLDGNDLTINYRSDDLPDDVEFTDDHNGTATFVWRTDYESEGEYTATFTISDGDLYEEGEVSITINKVNRDPYFTDIPEQVNVDETALIEFRVACEDPDRDDINITMQSDDLPEAAVFRFDEQTAGHFNWQTTYDDAGEYTAAFTVSDGDLTAEAEVVFTVTNVNRAPVWIDAEEYVESYEDQLLEYTIIGEDPDGQRLTIEMNTDDLPDEAEFTDIQNGSGLLSWDVGFEDAGEYNATFTISDGDLNDEVTVTFVVIDVNRTPELVQSIDNIEIDEDTDPRTIQIADLDTIFSDPDGDDLTFAYSEIPTELNMTLDENNILSFSPDDNFNIPEGLEVTVSADDNREENLVGDRDRGPIRILRSVNTSAPQRDLSINETFTITINPTPDSPEWVEIPGEINSVVNEEIYFVVRAIDVDGDDLEITANVPEGAQFNDNGDGSGIFSWQTTLDDEGDYTIVFELSDNDFVVETEVPVYIAGVREQVIALEQSWNVISININLSDEFYFEDEEDGPDVVLMFDQLRIDDANHKVERIKDENGNFYAPTWDEFNNIPFWNYEEGYQVKMTERADLSFTGVPIPAGADIAVDDGWNIVAYFPEYELSAAYNNGDNDYYVLSSIINNVVIAKDG